MQIDRKEIAGLDDYLFFQIDQISLDGKKKDKIFKYEREAIRSIVDHNIESVNIFLIKRCLTVVLNIGWMISKS